MSDRQRHRVARSGPLVRIPALAIGCMVLLAAGPLPDVPDPPADPHTVAGAGLTLFTQHVAPVLSASCFNCHGGEYRKSGLDLSTREKLLMGGDEGPAIVPGNAKESRLYQVIAHQRDPYMPKKADKLADEVIAKIGEWINADAPYAGPITADLKPAAPEPVSDTERVEPEGEQANEGDVTPSAPPAKAASDHWAFAAPKCPETPAVGQSGWVRNPIDAFVLAKLEAEGVTPSPEADRHTLIRRLSLDLLGLLPEPEEVEAFVNDASPEAYEKLVDRLLASPHFGERWARHWLDLARYADSDGYEKDLPRPNAWRYREWVIEAINRDLPFDAFTTEQLAGDLLPDAKLEQRVATGFHRNTLTNTEGGVDKEEFRVEAVVDRVNTTGTVWLGLTVGCAQCHSHKYDPLTQREYYSLFAFFNQADESDIPAPLAEDLPKYRREKQVFDQVHGALKAAVDAYNEHELPIALERWEAELELPDPYWAPLVPRFAAAASGATLTPLADQSLLVAGPAAETDRTIVTLHTDIEHITALRIEVLPHETLASKGPGRAPNGNFVLSELKVQAAPADNPADLQPVALQAASASFEQSGWPAAAAIDGDPAKGWGILPRNGQRHSAVFEMAQDVGQSGGTLLVLTFDQNYGGEHTLGRFRISATSSKRPVRATGIPDDVAAVLLTAADKRNEKQARRLIDYYRTVDPGYANLKKALAEHAAGSPDELVVQAPTLVRVSNPRATHVHVRGDFLRKGAEVQPDVPAVLPPVRPRRGTGILPVDHGLEGRATQGEPDRLDLAQWLLAEDNPLTARVAANRIWMHLFGTGLVATPEDFGTRGEPPSHPELLDWLATQFREHGWSRKAMIKLIVTSAAYRQASNARPELVDRDPKNRWLARQERFRLSAEVVRDLSLAASGLLYPVVGGPSVRPPQPAGIAELTYAGSASWNVSPAPDRYRRGLYTWFQRTSPYPMLMTFDSPDANVTCPRRRRSNTPLQSLTLLNDPVFVECAQHLGRRIAEQMEGEPVDRIRQAWMQCLSRPPSELEASRLIQLFEELTDAYEQDRQAAFEILGDAKAPDGHVIDAAAWAAVGRVLLNLDEFVTRG